VRSTQTSSGTCTSNVFKYAVTHEIPVAGLTLDDLELFRTRCTHQFHYKLSPSALNANWNIKNDRSDEREMR
jgi:hypothetical protein